MGLIQIRWSVTTWLNSLAVRKLRHVTEKIMNLSAVKLIKLRKASEKPLGCEPMPKEGRYFDIRARVSEGCRQHD